MKRHSKAKLKGTVLFTVISVMSLLIIFLTSTLVLATSASNRSHKNYASTQTEYTARAAIESFSEAMSRSDGVAQMIVNMNKTDILTPNIDINNPAMGEVGYYKSDGTWVPGQISIEYIDDTYTYNILKNEWEPQQVLKVTATAELAGEESTVSAYIRKKSPAEPQPLVIKGLQTAGGVSATTTAGYYSGALAMGIADNGHQTYKVGNTTLFDTDLTFINGKFNTSANLKINVKAPSTGTIVMGDLHLVNPLSVILNYTMSGDFIQKEIPYLYVDGRVSSASHAISVTGNDSPYNIFAGSWDTWGKTVTLNNSDLYLMNSGANNKLGGTSSTVLTAWNNSLYQRSESQFDSNGGNIYSKGNLTLSETKVSGSVRAEGDVVIKSGVEISGDLVVGGKLMIESHPTVNNIYCDNIKSSLSGSSAYKSVNNIYHPATDVRRNDCIKIDNNKYSFYVFYPTEPMEDWSGKKGLFGENVEWNDRVYYYWNSNHDNSLDYGSMSLDELRGYVDGSTGYIPAPMWDSSVPSTYIMQVDVTGIDGEGNLILSETSIITPDEFYYYDPASGAHLSESDLWVHTDEYYTKADFDGNDTGVNTYNEKTYYTLAEPHTEVDEYTATHTEFGYTPPAGTTIHAKSDYSDANIYPVNMTRENISGQKKNPDGTFSDYPNSNKEYKIITTLDEIKESIGCNGTTFDESIYYGGNMPDEIKALYNINGSVKIGADSPGIKVGSNIVGNCVLTSADVLGKTVNIKPTGTIWIALDNIKAGSADKAFNIIVDDSNGTVNFFINGKLQLDNSQILTKKVFNGHRTINETDKIGITFYGEKDSQIIYGNNCTIMGTAKCPYTKVTCSSTGGKVSGITYNGSPAPYAPHWIGNALFEDTSGGNNFTLLYTGSSSSDSSTITNEYLGDSWSIMYYDVY